MKEQKVAECNYEKMDQYDYPDNGYIEKAADMYSSPIGLFLINFSILEQELNKTISNIINNRSHELGYMIIDKLSMINKIELFYKICLNFAMSLSKKHEITLKEIKKDLDDLNLFRNSIVHANWQTLTKDGCIRVKILFDNQDGLVKFKTIKVTPSIIRENIKKADKLVHKIYKFERYISQV